MSGTVDESEIKLSLENLSLKEIPHCPNPKCDYFPEQKNSRWFRKTGVYTTLAKGLIQRYRCKYCDKTFSRQTFDIDYYVKLNVNYDLLVDYLKIGSGLEDLVRKAGVSSAVIRNRYDRLGRSCLGTHTLSRDLLPLNEDFAADGFESFSYSQYFPNNINLIAGSESEYIYSMGFSNLRRKGRMTEWQKLKRATLEEKGKADPKAIKKSMKNLFKAIVLLMTRKAVQNRILHTDEHKQYKDAIKAIKDFPQFLKHQTISSRAIRDINNPLFPVNYFDRQIRKDCSDHVRETVQFARCPSAMMLRMTVYMFEHNYTKPRRVSEQRNKIQISHATIAGLNTEDFQKILQRCSRKRIFLSKLGLGTEERKTWLTQWQNPGMPTKRYIPKFIAA